ncbi:MAG: hypothetical protein MUE79_08515, partial [Nitratireductor sp.]|nr:hypothetical protein [Nitratireductor sp.]
METEAQSYLELCILPQLAGFFLSSDAAILFDATMERVLWVNAPGAELVGEASIASAIGAEYPASHPLMRQFRDAARQLQDDEPIVRGFRISRGARTEFIQCVLANVELPSGEAGVLVTCTDERQFKPLKEHEAAQRALAGIENMAKVACVLDAYGLPIAFTRDFAQADFGEEQIEAMSRAAISGRSPVRRAVDDMDGNSWTVLVSRVGTGPDRLLLVAIEAAEQKPADIAVEAPASQERDAVEVPALQESAEAAIPAGRAAVEPPSRQLDLLESRQDEFPADDVSAGAIIAEGKAADLMPSDAPETVAPEANEDEGVEPVAEPALEADEIGEEEEASAPENHAWYVGTPIETAQEDRTQDLEFSGSADAGPNAPAIADEAQEVAGEPSAEDEFEEDDWARFAVEGPGGASTGESGGEERWRPELIEEIAGEEDETAAEPQDGGTENAGMPPSSLGETGAPARQGAAAGPQEEFSFQSVSEPVRFAWTVDDRQMFLSVSPELGQTLGPNAADIVGRRWSDVAKVFGFDRSGEIQRLLEKRDTWSGKSVLWPVQGTDLVVPVDLAALPAFSGARQFDG